MAVVKADKKNSTPKIAQSAECSPAKRVETQTAQQAIMYRPPPHTMCVEFLKVRNSGAIRHTPSQSDQSTKKGIILFDPSACPCKKKHNKYNAPEIPHSLTDGITVWRILLIVENESTGYLLYVSRS